MPEGAAQVRVKKAGAIAAVGGVLFWFTVLEAVAVQPFASVTVTAKVPAAFTLKAAVVAPVLHR